MNPLGGRCPALWGQVRAGAQDFLVKEASSHQPGLLGTPQGTRKAALLRPGGLGREEGSGRGGRRRGDRGAGEEKNRGMGGEVGWSERPREHPSPSSRVCGHRSLSHICRSRMAVPVVVTTVSPPQGARVRAWDVKIPPFSAATRAHGCTRQTPVTGGPPNTFMHEHPRAQRAGGLRGEGWVRRLPLFLSVKSWVREPTGGPPFPVISQKVTAPRQEGQSQPSPTVWVMDQNSCDKDPAHGAQGDGGRPGQAERRQVRLDQGLISYFLCSGRQRPAAPS